MDEALIRQYVARALELAGYRFGPEQSEAIATEFLRIATLAEGFTGEALPFELEPLASFQP